MKQRTPSSFLLNKKHLTDCIQDSIKDWCSSFQLSVQKFVLKTAVNFIWKATPTLLGFGVIIYSCLPPSHMNHSFRSLYMPRSTHNRLRMFHFTMWPKSTLFTSTTQSLVSFHFGKCIWSRRLPSNIQLHCWRKSQTQENTETKKCVLEEVQISTAALN